MEDRYYLVNNYLPCSCNCSLFCLKKDLLERGYVISSIKEITEEEFYLKLFFLKKHYKNFSLNYKFL